MIAEIGVILCLYVLTRLVPKEPRAIAVPLYFVTLLSTFAVIADLTLRGFGQQSVSSRLSHILSKDEHKASIGATTLPANVSILRGDGGSVTTNLGYGIAVAKNSSLRREWITINDASLPIRFEAVTGITTTYAAERYSGHYEYRTKLKLVASEPLAAIQVRYLTFNIWGEHTKTLSFEEVTDFPVGPTKEFSGAWNVYSENDVERHYASIAYIARVRLKNGRVLEADPTPILEEARKFSGKFKSEDLEPRKAGPGDKGRTQT